MRKRSADSEVVAFATVVCAYCIRDTVGDFSAFTGAGPFSIVVRAAPDLLRDLARAARLYSLVFPSVEPFDVAEASRGMRGTVNFDDVYATMKMSARVLIVMPADMALPRSLIAGVDAVLDAKPFDAELISQAVRDVHCMDYPVEEVEKILRFPIAEVLAAIRPGRPLDVVVARLFAAMDSGRKDEDVPRVEDLSGYGAAADWARELVIDLADWRDQKIPWRDVEAGLLLSGPPGVGKTMFARSLAKSAGAEFIASSLAQWQACGHLGDLLGAMRATFNEATAKAPCVLLIDEVDAIGDRTSFRGDGAGYQTQVVAALLEHLDGARRREGIVVIGACNHPHQMDVALQRPGRLGTHIHVGPPDRPSLQGIFRTHLRGSLAEHEIESVAQECEGFTGADVFDLVKNARRRARRRRGALSIEDLRAELPPVVPVTGDFRMRICIHESGHALVGMVLDVGELAGVVVRDAIRSRWPVGGAAAFDENGRLQTTGFFSDSIALHLGGMAAEAVFFGDHSDGCGGEGEGNDLQRAADIATAMVVHLGMGGALGHHRGKHSADREKLRRSMPDVNRRVEAILADQLIRAKEIIEGNKDFITDLAAILCEEGAISGERARELFKARRSSDAA